jgi:hypothetical protein
MTAADARLVSLYARLSKEALASNTSLEGYLSDMRAECARRGWIVAAEHVDDGKSGGKRIGRTGLDAWLDDGRSGRVHILMAPKVDRIGREGPAIAHLIVATADGLDLEGVKRYHAPRIVDLQGLDSAGNRQAFIWALTVGANNAHAELAAITERATKRYHRILHSGKFAGTVPPFGYAVAKSPDGKGYTLVLHEAEAAALREAAERVLSGDSFTSATRWINRTIKPRKADQWVRSVLQRMLISPVLLGRVKDGTDWLRDEAGNPREVFPPVLDLATHHALVARAAALLPQEKKRGRHTSRLLKGLLTCEGCDAPLGFVYMAGRAMYRCFTHSHGAHCPSPVAVSADPVEAHISALMAEITAPFSREITHDPGASALVLIDEKITQLRAERAIAEDTDDEERADELTAQLRTLRKEREATAAIPSQPVTEHVATGRTFAEEFADSDPQARRALVARAMPEIIVKSGFERRRFTPDRLFIVWEQGLHAE